MEMWTPISYNELSDEILKFEKAQTGVLRNFWFTIKINPEKWEEETYGKDGGGFWAVALIGKLVLWYNDIEEGFNISKYDDYGIISEYWCNQDNLDKVVSSLWNTIYPIDKL
jgi:hypothetical protein